MKRKLPVPGALWALFCVSPIGTASAQAGAEASAASSASRSFAEEVQEPIEDQEPIEEPELTGEQALDPVAAKIVAAAKAQIGDPYDASYVAIPYPNGDVPGKRGLCADVVVRALRAVGCDLQLLIHEDRKLNFDQYPRTWGWGRRAPDPNSDHRVVPNQMFFLGRFGLTLPKDVSPNTIDQWQPGDLVYWKSGSPLLHAGVVSDEVNGAGLPLVIHMSGDFCVQDDSLLTWPIIGHFRFPVKPEPVEHDFTEHDDVEHQLDDEDVNR